MGRVVASLIAVALAVGACGGESEAESAERVVQEFVEATNDRDADRLCEELLSPGFIAQVLGAEKGACKRQVRASRQFDLRLVEITKTEVDGDEAQVVAVLRVQGLEQPREFRLEKIDGEWKLAGGASPGA
jgi:hypothetical protein